MKKKEIKKYKLGALIIIFMLLGFFAIQNMELSLARYFLTKNIDIPIHASEYYADIKTEVKIFSGDSLNTNIIMKNNNGTDYMIEDLEYTISTDSDTFDIVVNDTSGGVLTGGSASSNIIPITLSKKLSANLSELEISNIRFNITYPYVDTKIITIVYTDYIQEGLKIHYDGVKNTVDGHVNTATVWKDLISDNDGTIFGTPVWNENALEFNGTNSKVSLIGNITEEYTMSFVVLPILTGSYPRLVGEGSAMNTGNPTFPAV